MKIYRVGGSVRDALLGLPVTDNDYVVTGMTPEQMIAAGFTPVGKDFPVFLHPTTHEEYALARTERKSAPGYRGFVFHCAPNISIEEDLQRRDLTINAMAIALDDDSKIIDPFGGQQDLAAGIFRHVSDAFLDDPVRILRVARFAARFDAFTIAPETMQLMRTMVQNGEVDALVPERVWQELARGLMEKSPSRMFTVLQETGVKSRMMPGLEGINLRAVDRAADQNYSTAVRWATLLAQSDSKLVDLLCARLKVPNEVRDITSLVLRESSNIEKALLLEPEDVNKLLERCDAFRRPERLNQVVQAVSCLFDSDFPQRVLLEQALKAAKTVPNDKIVEETMVRFPNQPQQIAGAIFTARVQAIKEVLGR